MRSTSLALALLGGAMAGGVLGGLAVRLLTPDPAPVRELAPARGALADSALERVLERLDRLVDLIERGSLAGPGKSPARLDAALAEPHGAGLHTFEELLTRLDRFEQRIGQELVQRVDRLGGGAAPLVNREVPTRTAALEALFGTGGDDTEVLSRIRDRFLLCTLEEVLAELGRPSAVRGSPYGSVVVGYPRRERSSLELTFLQGYVVGVSF